MTQLPRSRSTDSRVRGPVGATVVDVREPGEYVAGHVPGATLVPMGQLASRLGELDKSRPVYVVCASGNRSAAMTDLLRAAGYDAYSVAGGTSAWARSGPSGRDRRVPPQLIRTVPNATPETTGASLMSTDLTIIPIETPSLGDRSYVVHDGEVAFVVDPQRDIDRVLDVLEEHQVRLTDVFETHIHNDYVTGGLALAQRTGAAYHVNAEDEVSFDRTPIRDGETVAVGGRMRLTALSTPGHTFTHLSYALSDTQAGARQRRHGRGVLRRVAAVRRHRPPRPARRGAHRRPGPPPARLGPQAGRPAARRGRGLPHPRLRLVLRRDPVRCHRVHDRAGEAVQPGADPGRGDLRPRAPRRARRLPGVLRPHEPGQRRRALRARPHPTRARPTPASCAGASRPASGSSTCATAPRSPPATHPAPSTSASTARSRPTWAG